MPKIRLVLFCVFLLLPALSHGMELNKQQHEDLFKCSILEGCLRDFRSIREFLGTAIPILNSLAEDASVTQNIDTLGQLRKSILEIDDKIEQCHRDIINSCQVNIEDAQAMIDQKVKFLTDASAVPQFPWTDKNKKIYVDLLLRKLCSGSVSLESLRKTDGVLFFNTSCTGAGYLKELGPFKDIPGIDSVKAQSLCRMGMARTTTLSWDGVSRTSKFIFLSSDTRISGVLTPEGVKSNLEDVLVHEFVHYQRDIDGNFRNKTDELVSLRFANLRKRYLQYTDQLNAELNQEVRRIEQLKSLSDSERNSMLSKFLRHKGEAFRNWLTEERVPLIYGPGTSNAGYFGKDVISAGDVNFINEPKFVNGVAASKPYADQLTVIAGRPHSGKYLTLVDAYGLTNEEEYVAVALTMYRTDPAAAARSYSDEELRWLGENWRFGYLRK